MLALVTLLVACPSFAAPTAPVAGEWYVLVHAGASETADVSWFDMVWRFEPGAGRLEWIEHGVVAFRDAAGRYENLPDGRRARVAHAWTPSAAQLAEIGGGLQFVRDRNVRTKTLFANDRGDWSSRGSLRTRSASAIGYVEQWSIETTGPEPVFTQAAELGAGRAESLEGVTRFAIESDGDEGHWATGRYERDGDRSGVFWMWRIGVVPERGAVSRAAHRGASRPTSEASDRGLLGPGGVARLPVAALQERLEANDGSSAARLAIREAIHALVVESFERRGESAFRYRDDVERLTLEVERLVVVEGVPLEEVDRRYAALRSASPDDEAADAKPGARP